MTGWNFCESDAIGDILVCPDPQCRVVLTLEGRRLGWQVGEDTLRYLHANAFKCTICKRQP